MRTVAADPRGWIAQEVVALSTSPTHIGQRLAPRHVDLRPFAVNDGERVWVVPGGLTRVALREGSLVVNSCQAADPRTPGCWPALATPPNPGATGTPPGPRPRAPQGPAQETGPASGMVQQQQQQQQ